MTRHRAQFLHWSCDILSPARLPGLRRAPRYYYFSQVRNRLSPVFRRKRYVAELRIRQKKFTPAPHSPVLTLAEVSNNALRHITRGDVQKLQPLSLAYGCGQQN